MSPMIRMTVLYNLPAGTDEAAFLDWRLTDHEQTIESMLGVIRTGFARIADRWPEGSMPRYRFQSTIEWPDREAFYAGFYDETVQATLAENLKRLAEYSFLVSEVLIDSGA